MTQVISSKGGIVQVEIKGISEVLDRIRKLGQDIKQGADVGTALAGNFIQNEVQESIVGNRAEPKSVATGRFANSITLDKLQDAVYKIYTDVEYAKFLEFGTSKMAPRMHFRNTKFRNEKKVKEIIQTEIDRKI